MKYFFLQAVDDNVTITNVERIFLLDFHVMHSRLFTRCNDGAFVVGHDVQEGQVIDSRYLIAPPAVEHGLIHKSGFSVVEKVIE